MERRSQSTRRRWKTAGGGRVGVGVDEAGDDGPALQVDLGSPRAGQAADRLVVTDGEEPTVRDRDSGARGRVGSIVRMLAR